MNDERVCGFSEGQGEHWDRERGKGVVSVRGRVNIGIGRGGRVWFQWWQGEHWDRERGRVWFQ